MKVLAIVADIDPDNLGGAEWHFVEVLTRIAPKVEKVMVLVGPNTKLKKIWKKYDNINVVPVNYPHITNFYGVMFILFALPAAVRFLIKEKYDLIWAKQEFPQGVVGGILKMFFKIPLYITCQSARLNRDELVIKGPIPNSMKEFLAELGTPLMSFAFRQADLVGAVSNFSAAQVMELGGKRVVVVPNGVDTTKFKGKDRRRKKEKRLRIVTTSSLIYRNGVDALIRGCMLLPSKINWELRIAGDGPLRREMEQLAEIAGYPLRVKFLGRVPNSAIPSLLRGSDIFIRVSRAEGFGSSFIEAMAAGVPVVATPVGGIVDFVTNRETGLIVPVDNPGKLAEAIQELTEDEKLYRRLKVKALKMVRENYNWDKIAVQVGREFTQLAKVEV